MIVITHSNYDRLINNALRPLILMSVYLTREVLNKIVIEEYL